MLVWELLLIILALVFSLINTIVIYFVSKNSPILEIKILLFGFILFNLTYVFYLATPIFSSPDFYNSEMIFFDRIGYFISFIALLFLAYAFILPSYNLSYQSIFTFLLIDFSALSCAIYNSITFEVSVSGNFVDTTYNPIGTILIFFFYTVLLFFLSKRVREIISILGRDYRSPFTSMPTLLFLLIWAISLIFVYTFAQFFGGILLPQYIYNVLTSLLFLYVSFAMLKDRAFFFITPTSLDAVILMEQKTGIALFSKSFKEGLMAEELLSNVFSLLDISLQEALRSSTKLQEIRFGDKSVIIDNGIWVSSALIVSEGNFVTKSITRFLSKKFEEMYENPSEEKKHPVIKIDDYMSFESQIITIRPFIPL